MVLSFKCSVAVSQIYSRIKVLIKTGLIILILQKLSNSNVQNCKRLKTLLNVHFLRCN